MSETIDLRLLGERVKNLQDDMREVKGGLELLARTLPGQIQVMILELRTSLADAFDKQFALLHQRLDRTEAYRGDFEDRA